MVPMRQPRAGHALATLVLLAACDVPTKVPNWDMTWNVPAKGTTISVNSFLPSGVTVTPNGSAFQATVTQPAEIGRAHV